MGVVMACECRLSLMRGVRECEVFTNGRRQLIDS